MEKLYALYDGRAKTGDTDNAAFYVIASSEEEAIEDGKDSSWQDGIWYEYDVINGELKNERIRPDLPPNNKMQVGANNREERKEGGGNDRLSNK